MSSSMPTVKFNYTVPGESFGQFFNSKLGDHSSINQDLNRADVKYNGVNYKKIQEQGDGEAKPFPPEKAVLAQQALSPAFAPHTLAMYSGHEPLLAFSTAHSDAGTKNMHTSIKSNPEEKVDTVIFEEKVTGVDNTNPVPFNFTVKSTARHNTVTHDVTVSSELTFDESVSEAQQQKVIRFITDKLQNRNRDLNAQGVLSIQNLDAAGFHFPEVGDHFIVKTPYTPEEVAIAKSHAAGAGAGGHEFEMPQNKRDNLIFEYLGLQMYKMLGVDVPESYLVLDENGEISRLASQEIAYDKTFKDLAFPEGEAKATDFSQERFPNINQLFVAGLVLGDMDVTGASKKPNTHGSNVLCVDQAVDGSAESLYKIVKIDAENVFAKQRDSIANKNTLLNYCAAKVKDLVNESRLASGDKLFFRGVSNNAFDQFFGHIDKGFVKCRVAQVLAAEEDIIRQLELINLDNKDNGAKARFIEHLQDQFKQLRAKFVLGEADSMEPFTLGSISSSPFISPLGFKEKTEGKRLVGQHGVKRYEVVPSHWLESQQNLVRGELSDYGSQGCLNKIRLKTKDRLVKLKELTKNSDLNWENLYIGIVDIMRHEIQKGRDPFDTSDSINKILIDLAVKAKQELGQNSQDIVKDIFTGVNKEVKAYLQKRVLVPKKDQPGAVKEVSHSNQIKEILKLREKALSKTNAAELFQGMRRTLLNDFKQARTSRFLGFLWKQENLGTGGEAIDKIIKDESIEAMDALIKVIDVLQSRLVKSSDKKRVDYVNLMRKLSDGLDGPAAAESAVTAFSVL